MVQNHQSSEHQTSINLICPWFSLGYIIPHKYTDLDAYQFYRVAPEGMLLVTTGLNLAEYTLASVEDQMPDYYQALDLLAKKPVDRIALSGVPVAAALGRDRMLRLLEESSKRTGLVCDTDLEAHIATLKHLGVTKIAIASRWSEAVNAGLTEYLRQAGITVLAIRAKGRSLAQNKSASALADHELAITLGSEALTAAPDAQALLMPGGLWFAIHAVKVLEDRFKKPVLLNILSTTSNALRAYEQSSGQIAPRASGEWGMVLSQR
jgi:arylmalonate decarboxylase